MPKGLELESALCVGHSHRQVDGHEGSSDGGGRGGRGGRGDNEVDEDLDGSGCLMTWMSEFTLGGRHA